MVDSHGTLNHIFLCGGIGHWMWKHLVGLTPAAAGFARIKIAPQFHDTIGPKTVSGVFLSPKGKISSRWRVSHGNVQLTVSLPVGVEGAAIHVPKPTIAGKPAKAVEVTLDGKVIWNGVKLVGKTDGIISASDEHGGISFITTNGHFSFESKTKR